MDETKTGTEAALDSLNPTERLTVDSLRTRTRDLFRATLGMEGSMISNEVAASILNVSYKSVYRWKSNNPSWLPTLEQCPGLITFCEDTAKVREAMFSLVTAWPSVFGNLDKRTIEIVFGPVLGGIVFAAKGRTVREVAEAGTVYVLRRYGNLLEAQREE